VVAVVGPTATGKTALGVALAQQFSGEVISADSMQIYKGLDVGTAKVTPQETCGIPHHGVDILTPEKTFSVADFTALAGEYIQDITARGHLPLLVGGTGLYVQSLLYGVRFTAEKAPDGLREQLTAELEANGPEAMYAKLQAVDPEAAAAIHPNNKVRVLRALGMPTCLEELGLKETPEEADRIFAFLAERMPVETPKELQRLRGESDVLFHGLRDSAGKLQTKRGEAHETGI